MKITEKDRYELMAYRGVLQAMIDTPYASGDDYSPCLVARELDEINQVLTSGEWPKALVTDELGHYGAESPEETAAMNAYARRYNEEAGQ